MLIEIDGQPIQRPDYAADLPLDKYLECLSSGNSRDLSVEQVKVAGMLSQDPNCGNYRESVVRNGQEYVGVGFASTIANNLASEEGGHLELVPQIRGELFANGSPYWLSNVDTESRFTDAAIAVGNGLTRGIIIFRGDVNNVGNHRNGTVYVDGNVHIAQPKPPGITYVGGDVNLIRDSSDGILVVAGNVGKYSQRRRSAGGLNREVAPSPFIFTTHNVKQEIPDDYSGRDFAVLEGIMPTVAPTFVVDRERLRDWKPEAVRELAFRLCKDLVGVYLDDLRRITEGAMDVATLAAISRYNLFGIIVANSSGYYDGSRSNASIFDD